MMLSENALLTGAFFMEGLHEAGYDEAIKAWDKGCIEMVSELMSYVAFAEKLVTAVVPVLGNTSFPGVYEYEVCSPFGKRFGDHIIECGGNSPCRPEAEWWLVHETESFFIQCAKPDEIVQIKAAMAKARCVSNKENERGI